MYNLRYYYYRTNNNYDPTKPLPFSTLEDAYKMLAISNKGMRRVHFATIEDTTEKQLYYIPLFYEEAVK